MSAELIGILSVGAALLVGLGGLILTLGQWVRRDVRALSRDLTLKLTAVENRVAALENRVAAVERRQARLEGLIEGVARVFAPSLVTGD